MYAQDLFEQQYEFQYTQLWPDYARNGILADKLKEESEAQKKFSSLYFTTADNNKIWVPLEKPAFRNIQLFVPRYKFGNEQLDTTAFTQIDNGNYVPKGENIEEYKSVIAEHREKIHWECFGDEKEANFIPRFKYNCKLDEHYFHKVSTTALSADCYYPVMKAHYM
jgi:hypothetical protein